MASIAGAGETVGIHLILLLVDGDIITGDTTVATEVGEIHITDITTIIIMAGVTRIMDIIITGLQITTHIMTETILVPMKQTIEHLEIQEHR